MHPPFLLWGIEPPTKFSKRGAWQDLNFEKGVAGKGGGNFFRRGVAIFEKEITENIKYLMTKKVYIKKNIFCHN